MKDTYHFDSLYLAIIRQASKDLYKLYNTKHRTKLQNQELDELIQWFNDMNLSHIANKIIIEHWKPCKDMTGNSYGACDKDQLNDYD